MFVRIKSKVNGGATTSAIKLAREKSKVLFISGEDSVSDIIHNLYKTPEARYLQAPKIDKLITNSKKLIEETIKNNLFDDTEYETIIIDNFTCVFDNKERELLINKIEVFTERNKDKTVIIVERLIKTLV